MSALDVFDSMVPGMAPPKPVKRELTPEEIEYQRIVESNYRQPAPANDDGVVLIQGSTIAPVAIDWAWLGWLALGKFHIMAGAPGTGKTTIALACTATCSTNGTWPDGSRCNGGNVLIWSGEDDPADTLVPRLIGMGANMERVYFVAGYRVDGEMHPFDPARDMLRLWAAAHKIGDIKLLIVDPVVSAISGDSHKNAEVRRGLQPLVDLGASLGAAVIGITHLSKGTAGGDPTNRVMGSAAFGAVPRMVWLAAKIKGDDGKEKRVLVRSKANIAPDDGGFEYFIEQTEALPGIPTSIVTWGQAIEGNARDLLAEPDDNAGESQSTSIEAEDSLTRILGRDMVPSRDALEQMKAHGFSPKVTRTARERLGVIVKRSGFGKDTASYWKLPATAVVPSDGDEMVGTITQVLAETGRQELAVVRQNTDIEVI